MNKKKYRNKKTGKFYFIEHYYVINATNANDGQAMILYRNELGGLLVRERTEFFEKFEEVNE